MGSKHPVHMCMTWGVILLTAHILLEQRGVQAYGTEISSSVAVFRMVDFMAGEYIDGKVASR